MVMSGSIQGIPSSGGATVGGATTLAFNDNVLLTFGTDKDSVIVHNSAGLASDEELAGVIVGTSIFDTAIPANSMIISNITADGDIVFFIQTGGNSIEVMRIEGSTRSMLLPRRNAPATPAIAFGDGDSGFYELSDDVIVVSISGNATWLFDGSTLESDISGGPALVRADSSGTVPTLVPDKQDVDTGIGRFAPDTLSLIAGAFEMLRLDESTTTANYVGALFDAPDQVDEGALAGSTWRLMQTQPVTVDWTTGDTITALDGLALYLGVITTTADSALTVTTMSTLYVSNPVDGSNVTGTNVYPINTESAAFLTAAGVWTDNPSTREKKHNIRDVTPAEMHDALSQIRGRAWIYNDEWKDANRDRFGIVAEEQPEFLVGLGTTQRNVTQASVMAGFTLAAVSYHEDEITELKERIAVLEGA